jgi:hypothetical protein
LTGAAKVVMQTVDATTDEITSELAEALPDPGPVPENHGRFPAPTS